MARERARQKRKKRADPTDNGRLSDEELELLAEQRELAKADAATIFSHQANLVGLIRDGIPARGYHALSHGILVRGKRHLCAAPAKVGKSIAWQIHLTKMCLEGETVIYIDKENGKDEFARRLECFTKAWDSDDDDLEVIEAQFLYLEFPRLSIDSRAGLNYLIEQHEVDLVVFDSQRMVLSDLGLAEDSSDDYSRFMNELIMGLDATVLILDNTGHADKDRGRGTSSKIDTNEVLFSMAESRTFDVNATGKLRLMLEATRFDKGGPWAMELGGGTYGSWQLDGPPPPIRDVVIAAMPSDGDVVTGNQMEQRWANQGYGNEKLRGERQRLIAAGEIGTDADEPGRRRGQATSYWRMS